MSEGHGRRRARTAILSLAVAGLGCGVAAASAGAVNPWLHPTQFLDMAHQGGELEAPGNTLYAFKTAMRDRGADSIEMDSYVTKDGYLVISHDASLGGTTNFGTPSAPAPFSDPGASDKIWDYDLADLKKLDDAYWFAPGDGQYNHGNTDRPYRGVATGAVPPPPGYAPNDFRIPTFQEVLDAFPDTRINIELKDQAGFTAKGIEAAHALADILAAQPGGDNENVLVASFGQPEMEAFHADMPLHQSLSASLDATSGYALNNEEITPTPAALQPPDKYDISGTTVDAPELLKAIVDARGDPYAIHVWGANGTVEDDALYQRMLDVPVQGYFSQEPAKLADFLCRKGVPRPDGSSHCTPNPDMTGLGSWEDPVTQPLTPPAGPALDVGRVKPSKHRVRAGRKLRIAVWVSNSGGTPMSGVRVCGKVAKKARKEIRVARCRQLHTIGAGAAERAKLPVLARRKAHGRYTVRISIRGDGGLSGKRHVRLRVKR